MSQPAHQTMLLSTGGTLSFVVAGEKSNSAVLLIHGFPSSSRTFRDLIPLLADGAFVVAPDMPGFGGSGVLPVPSFQAMTAAIRELLRHLSIGPRFIYLHDFGAPVGLELAMAEPEQVLGLIVQNANAHHSGFGPAWEATKSFWTKPSKENEEQATAHLTYEGIRDQYIAQVPEGIAAKIGAECWDEDWRVMQLPGRMATQRALIADYGNYVSRFDAIADYLKKHQPPSLMIWGRHDSFFDLSETLSWMRELPRMEAHILDAGHFVLETAAPTAAQLMIDFIEKNGKHPARAAGIRSPCVHQ